MNKKFTMLLASAMLATAFSAGAAVDAKKGDAILLKSGTDNLSALTGTNFGKLGLTSTPADLNDWELKGLNGATWTVSAKKNTLAYIIHSGFISGYQNRYGDNLKPPTNVYHRMTA